MSNRGGNRPGAGRKTLAGKSAGVGDRSKRIYVTLSSLQMAWVDSQECSTSDYIRSLVNKDIEERKQHIQ